jgi:hypothetical protein
MQGNLRAEAHIKAASKRPQKLGHHSLSKLQYSQKGKETLFQVPIQKLKTT